MKLKNCNFSWRDGACRLGDGAVRLDFLVYLKANYLCVILFKIQIQITIKI
jgi:hypothetical protein